MGFHETSLDRGAKFTPQQVGAAVSKLVSASIGDIAIVFSKSAAHKHYNFADLEWMILPAVLSGQFYVAELEHKDIGARAPVAVVLWASVSDDVDARLRANPEKRIKLRPDEWKSGEHVWILDVAGDAMAAAGALKQLSETVLTGRDVNVMLPHNGSPVVRQLSNAIAGAADTSRGGA